MNKPIRSLSIAIGVMAGALLSSQSHAAAAGKVLFAYGEAFAEDASGAQRGATRNSLVSTGDTLVTGEGRMQVRMNDGGFIALQPRTRFTIENYAYAGTEDGSESAIFRLVCGGIRAITGIIGKENRATYRLNTAVATIGIRGTTFKALICDGDCAGLQDGLYAGGGEGVIVVENGKGEIELSTGENAYVADVNAAPIPTDADPAIGEVPAPRGETEELAKDATKIEFLAGEVVFQGSVSGVGEVRSLQQGAIAYNGSIVFDGELETGFGTIAGARGSDLILLNGSFNSDDGLIGIAGTDDEGSSGALFFTNIADARTDGILYLGRWTAATGTAFADDGFSQTVELDAADSAHYIVGVEEVIIPGFGSANYTFSGLATSSTSSDGSIGFGITGGNVTVDFGAQFVTANFQINHAGTYDIQSAGFLGFGEASFNTSGAATGPGCAVACSAATDRFLSGSGAIPTRAGLAYEVVTDANIGITGVGGFNLQ